MSDTGSPQRRGRPRDPRLDSAPPSLDDAPLGNPAPREGGTSRIASLEAAIAQLKSERAADADDIAAMLVRVADAERTRTAVEQRALALAESVRALETKLGASGANESSAISDRERLATVSAALEREQARTGELDTQLAEARAQAQGAEAQAQRLRFDASALEDSLAAARTRIDELSAGRDNQARAASQELEATIATLKSERARAADLDSQLGQVRLEHAEELEATLTAHATSSLNSERAHAEVIRQLEAQQAERIEAAHQDRAAALSALRAEHERTDAERVASFEETSRALRTKHTKEVADLRDEFAASKRHSARTLEEERSAAARARQRAAAGDISLAAAREAMGRAGAVLDEIDRREEMAGALRKRSLEQARQALAVVSGMPGPPPPDSRGPATTRPGPMSSPPAARPLPVPSRASIGPRRPVSDAPLIQEIDDLDLDLAE